MRDLIVCTNNESTSYSKITDSTKEQYLYNVSNHTNNNNIEHPSNNNNIAAILHSPEPNVPEPNFIDTHLSPFDFDAMKPLQISHNKPISYKNEPTINLIAKTLFSPSAKIKTELKLEEPSPKVRKSIADLILDEPSPKVRENIAIKKQHFDNIMQTNFAKKPKPLKTQERKNINTSTTLITKESKASITMIKSKICQDYNLNSSTENVHKNCRLKQEVKNNALKNREIKKQNIKVNKNNISCEKHQLHHVDLQVKEKHDIMFYTKSGECLHKKRCDGSCKKDIKDMLCCKKTQVLVCQKCLLSATTDDNGCIGKTVYVICYICRQQKFDTINNRKRRRCQQK